MILPLISCYIAPPKGGRNGPSPCDRSLPAFRRHVYETRPGAVIPQEQAESAIETAARFVECIAELLA
jgi:hypothetical protein